MEQRFMKAVRDARRAWIPPELGGDERHPSVQLREWERDGWTYHAKGKTSTLISASIVLVLIFTPTLAGIWLRPTPYSYPYLTLFGSTNLNNRSANLDTELSFIMVTTSTTLRKRLGEELDGLRDHSQTWRGGERHVRKGTKFLVGLVGGML